MCNKGLGEIVDYNYLITLGVVVYGSFDRIVNLDQLENKLVIN